LQWFYNKIVLNLERQVSNVDYGIGISAQPIRSYGENLNWFFKLNPSFSKIFDQRWRLLSVITSDFWEKIFSPPSLFGYIASSVFICSLHSLSRDYTGSELKVHSRTKGCIFDFTPFKFDRRTLVSNPILCQSCKKSLHKLETIIRNQSGDHQFSLMANLNQVLSREWIGSPEKRDSSAYNLNKIYKYNVDRNSGFYKTPMGKIPKIPK